MIDLDRQRIDLECPRCHFPTRVFLRQVRLCDVIICGGCKGTIQLVDQSASLRKARRDIEAALDDLVAAFSKFGR